MQASTIYGKSTRVGGVAVIYPSPIPHSTMCVAYKCASLDQASSVTVKRKRIHFVFRWAFDLLGVIRLVAVWASF